MQPSYTHDPRATLELFPRDDGFEEIYVFWGGIYDGDQVSPSSNSGGGAWLFLGGDRGANAAYPAANCEGAIRPGLRPAAAAMAARLALAGNWAAPCRAAAAAVCNPDAVTITWLVPRGEDKVEVVCVVLVSLALDASAVEAEADGEGLNDGEVTAEEAGGAVEMTVAVLLDVLSVVPEGEPEEKGTFCGSFSKNCGFVQPYSRLSGEKFIYQPVISKWVLFC